jgi:hypothetical protein
MARSLSDLIREGFAQARRDPCADQALAYANGREPALSRLGWGEMVALTHRRSVPATRQDAVLAAAIRCYRTGSQRIWAPVLLAMLAPAVVAMAARVRCSSPELNGEDLDQQAVLESLRVCAEMPLPEGCRFVQRRALMLANKRLTRWAARENRHLAPLSGRAVLEEMA